MRLHRSWRLSAALIAVLVLAHTMRGQDTLKNMGPINGYTGERFDTTGYAYDYLVDGSLPQDDAAHKRFRTVEAAYSAAPAGTPGHPTVIGIKPDVYLLPGHGLTTGLAITKNWITLLGLTDDRRKVVLADNRGNQEGAGVLGASNNGYTMTVTADGFSAINLTIMNYCNLDYEYPGDASKNLKMRSPVITQAVALDAQGDRHSYSHVAFLGRLDTLFIRTQRSYFSNVFVEGTDDFIGGGTVGVWKDSEVYFPTGNGVMSASGITFLHTVFKASRGLEFYKSMRNPATLIDCTLPVSTKTAPVAWLVWKSALRQNLYSLTYRTHDADGRPVHIMDSILGPPRYELSRELSDDEVKAFNPWNLLHAAVNGEDDGWDPAGVRAKYEPLGNRIFRLSLNAKSTAAKPTGDASGYSAFSTITPGNITLRTGSTGATYSATVLPALAEGSMLKWSSPSPLVTFSASEGTRVTVMGNNKTERAEYVPIRATATDGFYVTGYAYVEPAYIAPPAFVKQPQIETPQHGAVRVNYQLDLGGREDQSLITWLLCADAQCTSSRTAAVTRGDEPLRSYELTQAAVGKYVAARVAPKHNISDPGGAVLAVSATQIAAADVVTRSVDPNFRNFVLGGEESLESGLWSEAGTWTSQTNEDLRNGYGIRVASAGAALLYVNDAPTGDMKIVVVMDPEKTAGQGFGVPGSPSDDPKVQRADLFIKYDPRTRTGYSLRFWRTTQSAEKCMFQLYRIVDGKGEPASAEQQLTGVFKPQTTLTLSYAAGELTATGSNTTDKETLHLEAHVPPNSYGGAGAYWSGSVPVGNSVTFSRFEVSYGDRASQR
jgi:hypothetical protein